MHRTNYLATTAPRRPLSQNAADLSPGHTKTRMQGLAQAGLRLVTHTSSQQHMVVDGDAKAADRLRVGRPWHLTFLPSQLLPPFMPFTRPLGPSSREQLIGVAEEAVHSDQVARWPHHRFCHHAVKLSPECLPKPLPFPACAVPKRTAYSLLEAHQKSRF